jgi:hypothetical protein
MMMHQRNVDRGPHLLLVRAPQRGDQIARRAGSSPSAQGVMAVRLSACALLE